MKLKNNQTMIFGLKGGGKSNFFQYLLSKPQYQNTLVYDVCREHAGYNRYIPEHTRGKEAIAEFDGVTSRLITDVDRNQRPELFAIEEVSRLAPTSGRQADSLMELVDLNRHYGIGLLGVARRPAKVNTDLTELADNLVIFRLTGKNDVRRLNQEADGLGDKARQLDDYHFIHVRPDRSYTVHAPVPEMDTTGNL